MSGPSLARRLEAHCAALAGCRRCADLLPVAPIPVLPEARAPRAMLVGQAPGRVEAVDRRPFAGRAGRTLFRWLAEAGIQEEEARRWILMSAVTRCFPGASRSGRGDRVPGPEERRRCADWLDTELRLVRPPVLILVGRLAIDRFLPPLPLERLVGSAHPVTHAGGECVAIPLPHPSGASSWIHAPGHRLLLDRSLALVRERLAASSPGVPPLRSVA